ncbi:hypothetical protein D3C77_364350 [compost metagenome]
MWRRQCVQIRFWPSRIDDHLVSFAVGGAEYIVELPVPGQLLQQMVECLLPIPHHDEVHALNAFHPVLRIVRYLRPAEDDGRLGHDFFEHVNNTYCLFDVPDVAGEPNHVGPALE